MTYGSVCSGIEAASLAWVPLGWRAAWYSEIDRFPSAVLAERWPETPNLGDMTRIHNRSEFDNEPIDLLVGGTPCQSFSVAGLRRGLSDPRGNLALVFLGIAARLRPRWIVWENVPGVLSSGNGRDFGSFLGGLVELGYGFAYRVLDAQYWGVAQRRRRVFVVGYLGDWRRAAAVLFDPASLRGDSPPSRDAGEGLAPAIAPSLRARSNASHRLDSDAYVADLSPTIGTRLGRQGDTDFTLNGGVIAHSLRADGFDASEDGTGRGTPLVAIGQDARIASYLTSREHKGPDSDATTTLVIQSINTAEKGQNGLGVSEGPMYSLTGRDQRAVAFQSRASAANSFNPDRVAPTLDKSKSEAVAVQSIWGVRRIIPREAERLQGIPDDYTLITYKRKPAKDGPRYKAIGNSMAVPVMRWLGKRIDAVEATP